MPAFSIVFGNMLNTLGRPGGGIQSVALSYVGVGAVYAVTAYVETAAWAWTGGKVKGEMVVGSRKGCSAPCARFTCAQRPPWPSKTESRTPGIGAARQPVGVRPVQNHGLS